MSCRVVMCPHVVVWQARHTPASRATGRGTGRSRTAHVIAAVAAIVTVAAHGANSAALTGARPRPG